MDLNTLSKNIELNIVGYEHGWGVEITYTYRRTGQELTPLRAFHIEGHLGKNHDKHDTDRDESTFLSVDLPTRPEKGDKITYAGETWYVERLLSSNPYDIVCVSNERHATGRSTRRER
jgi:hypothetical protein